MSLATYQDKSHVEIGVDEAGYGALYGRVYAAAVVWPHDFNHKLIKDSKRFTTRQRREEAYKIVVENAISYGIAFQEPAIIDEINILEANMRAMHDAIEKCNLLPDKILVDGNNFKPYIDETSEYVSYETVKKGDSKYAAIAAASILAKVTRDRWILEECKRTPDLVEKYGLDHNMGYGSEDHLAGLKKWGVAPNHRKVKFTNKFVN